MTAIPEPGRLSSGCGRRALFRDASPFLHPDPGARQRPIAMPGKCPAARITITHGREFLTETGTAFPTIAGGRLAAPPFNHTHGNSRISGGPPHGHEGRNM